MENYGMAEVKADAEALQIALQDPDADPERVRDLADRVAGYVGGLDIEIFRSMRAIVDYDSPTEQADYEREGEPEGHVFTHLRKVDDFLTKEGL